MVNKERKKKGGKLKKIMERKKFCDIKVVYINKNKGGM